MEITWKMNEIEDVEVYTGAFTEQDVKESNYDVYLSSHRQVKEFFQSIGVTQYQAGDNGNATVPPDSFIEGALNDLTHTCPKCKRASHWDEWDRITAADLGKNIPSLGFDDVPDYKYCCPKCEKWSTQRDIEESSKPKEEKDEEQPLQETLDAILMAYTKSGKLDEQTKHLLRQKLQECASLVEEKLLKNENEESRESTRIYTATKDGNDESRESIQNNTVTKNENGQTEIMMIGECFNSSYGDVYCHDIKAKDDRSLTDLLYYNVPKGTKVKVKLTILDEEEDTK